MECIVNQVDPQFETAQGLNYRLSVLLHQEGFSFLVTHAVSKKVMKLSAYKLNEADIQHMEKGDWPVNGKEYFDQLRKVDCAQMLWQQVEIAVAVQKISVAPHDYIENNNAEKLVSAAYSLSPSDEIVSEPVFDRGPVIITIIPSYILEFCSEIFPGSAFRNSAAVFVKGILRKHSQLLARQVFINIYPSFFEISVIQGLRLIYLNAFRYSSPSDVLYYVIFVLEQLGFIPSEEKVTLMGDINSDSTIFLQLKMYCGSLNLIEKPAGLIYSDSFSTGTGMHKHFSLLNLPLCE